MDLIQFQRCENVWVCSFDELQSFFRPKNNHKSSSCRWIGAFHGIAYEIILAWHFDHCLCVACMLVTDSMVVVVTINDIEQITQRAPPGRDCWYANLFEYISVNKPQRSSFNLVQLNYPNGHIGPKNTRTQRAREGGREWMDSYSDDLNWKILRLIFHGIMTKFHRFILWCGACCVRRTNANWSHKFYGHTVQNANRTCASA